MLVMRVRAARPAAGSLSGLSARGHATPAAQLQPREQREQDHLQPEQQRAQQQQQQQQQQRQQQQARSVDKAHALLLAQLEAHEIRIPVPWGHIAGKWWGPRDRRPLLALHGWGDNAGSFDRLATSLRGTPLLALDLPGHGLSSPAPRGAPPADRGLLMLALRRAQRALGLTSVSLVGHSAGDAVALLYAATFPSQVDLYISLDLLVPAPANAESDVKAGGAVLDEMLEAEEAADSKATVGSRAELLETLLASRGGSLNRHAAEILLRRGSVESSEEGRYSLTLDPRLAALAGRRPPLLTADLALAAARNVRCPVLAVLPQWRAPRTVSADAELREKALDALRMASKTLTAVQVDGTHHVHLNNPEVVMPAVQDFLQEHRRADEEVKVSDLSP